MRSFFVPFACCLLVACGSGSHEVGGPAINFCDTSDIPLETGRAFQVWQLVSVDNADGSRTSVRGMLQVRIDGNGRGAFATCNGLYRDEAQRLFCESGYTCTTAWIEKTPDALHVRFNGDFPIAAENDQELVLSLPMDPASPGLTPMFRTLPDGNQVDAAQEKAHFVRVGALCTPCP
jgi:hypothetical protein